VSDRNSPERSARVRGASAALTMEPLRALLAALLGPPRATVRPGLPVTTLRGRALGACLFLAGLAAILAVTLVRA
jgi:hypothetical protein